MAENPIPQNWRCKHLFLLIGANPLPNWVAARLLLNDGGRAHLIHSPDTLNEAKRLEKILVTAKRYETAEADEGKIYTCVAATVKQLIAKGETDIGLNYTGGTKMMSVHAHRAVADTLRATGGKAKLSYLDARSLSMKFDGGPQEGYVVGRAARACIELDTLLRLHEEYDNDDTKISYIRQGQGIAAAQGLAQLHSFEAGQRFWRDWCNATLNLRKLNNEKLQKDAAYRQQIVALLDDKKLPDEAQLQTRLGNSGRSAPILKGYRDFLQAAGNAVCTLKELAKTQGFTDSLQVARWLDGQWLEHYTFSQLEQCSATAPLHDAALNLEPINKDLRKFETDVVVLRGYQLFYFSCYSGSNPSLAKSKLFEAMIRASQLGGEESRLALVSCVKDPDKVRREVEASWQCEGRIRVFGAQHLSRLEEELRQWFVTA